MASTGDGTTGIPNGAAMAAVLAAGIGAFALGVVVILNEAGVFSAPAVYAPAGGVSGRTALAAVVWLIGWAVLHRRWKAREMSSRRVHALAAILTGVGVLLCLPLVWQIF
jgi:hypothetical protein